MSALSIRKKMLLGAFALSTLLVPVIFGAAQNSADPIQLVRIQPNYPTDAFGARREGSVELEFTIAANGAVKDVVVLSSTAPEFEAPAVAAVLRWRYAPTNMTCVGTDCRTNESVQPVERPGMRTVINYRIEDARPEDD